LHGHNKWLQGGHDMYRANAHRIPRLHRPRNGRQKRASQGSLCQLLCTRHLPESVRQPSVQINKSSQCPFKPCQYRVMFLHHVPANILHHRQLRNSPVFTHLKIPASELARGLRICTSLRCREKPSGRRLLLLGLGVRLDAAKVFDAGGHALELLH
jgi:hypothetical protein